MMTRLHKNLLPLFSRWRTFCFALGLLLLPLVAFAHDEDEKPVPLDPQTRTIQLWTYGAIGLGITLFLVWYWLRWWQLRHGPSVSRSNDDQD